MGFCCFALGLWFGLAAATALFLFGEQSLVACAEVRFRLGAQWRYSRTLHRSRRPALWRWPAGAARLWCHQFFAGDGTRTTELAFAGGVRFRRGPLGRPERVR